MTPYEEQVREIGGLKRKLELVVQTGMLLTQTLNLEQVVQAVTDAGLELSGAQFGAFFYNVINAAGESYVLYALSGVDREKFAKFPMPRNTAIFAPTFEGRRIVRSGDITRDPDYGKNAPHHGMPEGHLPVRSYLAVPVKNHEDEVLGGLFYGHERPDVFDESVEDLVATVAAQAAVAIDNVRLRDRLNRGKSDLESARQAQRDASQSLNELAAIVASSDDAILSKDLNGIITSWNQAAARIFGYTSEEMIGASILRLIPEELHGDEAMILDKIRRGERIEHYETERVTRLGKRIDVSLTISPVRDATGAIIGASKILRDISNRRRMERSLVEAEKIASAGRMAATIAHEINNPLEAVVNLLYLLRPSLKDDEARQYLEAAESELTRVSHIARQTLGFYREHASAGSTSLADLVAQTVTIYKPRCQSAGICIATTLGSSRKIVLRRGEMMQVVSNLIANAIYAMPSGGELSIAVKDACGGRDGVVLTIADNGTGIEQEHLPRVFEAFFTTRSSIGTGIGLFVAKQFIEGHGGTIEITSSTAEEDHGTTVSIFLPLHTAYEAEDSRTQAVSPGGDTASTV
jgi:PAS domain S-box-containing protein